MKRYLILIILFLSAFILHAQQNDSVSVKPTRYVQGIYRVPLKDTCGMHVWIVDGLAVRREIFGEFLYGGNPAPYLFVPPNEIWIDNDISVEEYKYTLAHELNEYKLMMETGMSYAAAHDSSLSLERSMRKTDSLTVIQHENEIHKVSPTDCDGLKQIKDLPDSIILRNIYRQKYSSIEGIDIWVVDGSKVRQEIFPDFGFSGNDLAYNFIPENEIWIDGQVSCEETETSVKSELSERALMKKGLSYDEAYSTIIKSIKEYRADLHKKAIRHRLIAVPAELTREYCITK
jgi:hypothetical protein